MEKTGMKKQLRTLVLTVFAAVIAIPALFLNYKITAYIISGFTSGNFSAVHETNKISEKVCRQVVDALNTGDIGAIDMLSRSKKHNVKNAEKRLEEVCICLKDDLPITDENIENISAVSIAEDHEKGKMTERKIWARMVIRTRTQKELWITVEYNQICRIERDTGIIGITVEDYSMYERSGDIITYEIC